jgi:hypothetical protein
VVKADQGGGGWGWQDVDFRSSGRALAPRRQPRPSADSMFCFSLLSLNIGLDGGAVSRDELHYGRAGLDAAPRSSLVGQAATGTGSTKTKATSGPRFLCCISSIITSIMTSTSIASMPQVTYSEINKHSSPNDCWIILHSKVFDVSAFHAEHPGGSNSMTASC